MKRTFLPLVLSLTSASFVFAESSNAPGNSFTIPGTWTWKVGARVAEKSAVPDFWWEQVSESKRDLVPQNGAVAAVVDGPYNDVNAEQIKASNLTKERIDGSQLRVGRVVIFKTTAGQIGKFEVAGYLPLERVGHDTIPEYDLRVKWLLY